MSKLWSEFCGPGSGNMVKTGREGTKIGPSGPKGMLVGEKVGRWEGGSPHLGALIQRRPRMP